MMVIAASLALLGAKMDVHPMADRTFTFDEAKTLLPILESLLRASIASMLLLNAVGEP